jgi:hypothetical protein
MVTSRIIKFHECCVFPAVYNWFHSVFEERRKKEYKKKKKQKGNFNDSTRYLKKKKNNREMRSYFSFPFCRVFYSTSLCWVYNTPCRHLHCRRYTNCTVKITILRVLRQKQVNSRNQIQEIWN